MKRKSKLFTSILGIFAFAFVAGFVMPEPASATHCQSVWSCGCGTSSERAYEKVYCDGRLVSTKCYQFTC